MADHECDQTKRSTGDSYFNISPEADHTTLDEGESDREMTRKDVKDLETNLFDRAATLNAEVGVSRDMTNSLKRLLKRAKRTRDGGSQDEFEEVAGQLRRMISDVCAELEAAEIEIPEIDDRIPGGAQPAPRRTRKPTADEMEDEHKREFDRKFRVCIAMDRNKSARGALEYVGINDRTPRWARKIYKAYKEDGPDGLKDGRRLNGRNEIVMTRGIKDRIVRLWFDSPAAGPKAIWTDLKEELKGAKKEGELPATARIPSYSSVRDFIACQPKAMQLVRDSRLEEYRQKGRSIIPINWTDHANQRWQADTTQLPIWARRPLSNGEAVPTRVWHLGQIDVHSRAVPGGITRGSPANAAAVRQLYLKGILPGESEAGVHGLPQIIQTDNGTDYTSHEVSVALAELGIEMDLDPPNYPQRKGIIERWFQTLDQGLLRRLPGHKSVIGKTEEAAMKHIDKLLTVEQIAAEIETWTDEVYHQRIHGEKKARPFELWTRTVRLREAESLDDLMPLWVASHETRQIGVEGIRVTFAGEQMKFWAPFFDSRIGEEVRIGLNREDASRIMVYSLVTGERLGWAFNRDHQDCPYDFRDVINARRETEGTLKKRVARYQGLNQQEARRARAEDPQLQAEFIEDLERAVADDDEVEDNGTEEEPVDLEAVLRREAMQDDPEDAR